MCWERKTWRPTLSATAVFMCAPTARMTGSSSATLTGSGAISPGAPQDAGRAGRDAHDAVVGVSLDRPVVHEEDVGQTGQTRERLELVRADGLLAQVPARGDERDVDGSQQQVVERRGGEHEPELRPPRRDRSGDGRVAEAGQEDDGSLRGLEERRGSGRDLRERPRGSEIPHHEGEGLVLARLAGAEPPDGGLVPRVAHQVEAAEALACEDLAPPKHVGGERQRLVSPREHRHRIWSRPRAAARRRDRPSAARESGGREGSRTPPGTRRRA